MRNGLHFGSSMVASGTAFAKLITILLMILAMLPVQFFFVRIDSRRAQIMPQHFHRLLIRVLGFHIRIHGAIAQQSPIMFVANHASYLDIPVLGSLLQASFIAKAEVASWPLIGTLAKMQNTLFVERRATKVTQQREQLRQRLAKGQNLVLFPEGTSSDGLRALPFKSSLFGLADQVMGGHGFIIQPVSITCTELDGLPLTRAWRPYYAWYGDMTLAGHLWNVLKFGHFTVDVTFHDILRPGDYADRKTLAQACQTPVAHGIEHSLARARGKPVSAISALLPSATPTQIIEQAKKEDAI